MSSQRRFSKGANDNELSLEQRLVMQLSAAMNQEDSHSSQQDHAARNQATEQNENHGEHFDPGLIDLPGLLGSALGGESDKRRHTGAGGLPDSPAAAVPSHDKQGPSDIHSQGQSGVPAYSDITSDNPDALLASLLGGNSSLASTQLGSGTNNSGSTRFDSDHLSQAVLSQLENLGHSINAAGLLSSGNPSTDTQEQSAQFRSQGLSGVTAPGLPDAHQPRHGSEWRSSRPQSAEQGQKQPAAAQTNKSTGVSTHSASPEHDSTTQDLTLDRVSSLNPTLIDPEVSSIQSVLQLLLTNGAKGVSDLGPALSRGPTSGSPSDRPEQEPSSSTKDPGPSRAAMATPENNSTDYGSLFGLSLGAEDQSLVESLKNAINVASGVSAEPAAHSSSVSETLASSDPQPSSSSLSESTRAATVASKPKRLRLTEGDEPFSATSSGHQPEFNASDPDTLRAIQQALLSALGPSAASTSLAESLTSSQSRAHTDTQAARPSHEIRLAPAPPRTRALSAALATRPSDRVQTAHSSSALVPTPSSSLGAGASKPLLPPGALHKSQESSLAKHALKRSPPKAPRPAEIDKQKQREGNAARKRKWREVNQMQNRDHDLRQRIVKRAHELYGEKDTQEKSTWIEQEFNRRRHRRILRAGIHSIVESAKARAAKAQETGDHAMIPFGRSNMGSVMGTLSQQSRQAASSHLSHLFRNSNAALEPQLSSEKVPMPLTPYMLVATPKRPPYKLPCGSAHTELKLQDAGNQKIMQGTPKPFEVEVTSHQERQNEPEGPLAANTGIQESSGDHRNKASSEPASKSNWGDEKEALSPSDNGTGAQQSKIEDELSSERPKHRYALVGDVNLGVPPNLGAIYQRVRGSSLRENLWKQSRSPERSQTQASPRNLTVDHVN